MGLQKQEARRVYLSISDGNIVRNHQSRIEGVTVERINKNGKVMHEEFFNSLTGVIKEIKSKETSFGMVWEIVVFDGEDEFQLSWNYSSRYTNNFFRALPNVDLSLPVSIHPWSMKDKQDPTKKIVGLFLYQKDRGFDKNRVPFYYTKEDQKDWPDIVQVKRKGKMEWDDSEQLSFIESMVKDLLSKPIESKVTEEEPGEDPPF